MKMEKEHTVPLSPRAIEILREMERLKTSDYVFNGSKEGKPMSNMAMLTLLKKRMEYKITVHGFRSTFRDWVAEHTDFSSEVAELALAHAISNRVEAAYRRGNLLLKRRALMKRWEEFFTSPKKEGALVQIKRKYTDEVHSHTSFF